MTYEELQKLDHALDHDAGANALPPTGAHWHNIYTYGVRVGYKAVYRFGSARIPEDDEC